MHPRKRENEEEMEKRSEILRQRRKLHQSESGEEQAHEKMDKHINFFSEIEKEVNENQTNADHEVSVANIVIQTV